MRRRTVRSALIATGMATAALVGNYPMSQATAQPDVGRYVVVLRGPVGEPAAVARAHGRAFGFQASQVYEHVLQGYAADLTDATAAALRRHPQVRIVEVDPPVVAHADQPPQTTSNGVLRIGAATSSTRSGDAKGMVDINVAVLDDGIDETHPDLNVASDTSCIHRADSNPKGLPPGNHGTLVGGFIGALDNEIGRVGVAPGARLWSVQVLDTGGRGTNSEIMCGLDWVVGTRTDADPDNDIAVANLSLGGPAGIDTGRCPGTGKDAYHTATCNTIAAGVVIVASAGNKTADIRDVAPATYDEVLTATGMADFDGLPGGLQNPFCPEDAGDSLDDTVAWFSNFATLAADRAHVVAAPSLCIGSTYPVGTYAISSGTSFAAPLVTGAVALCMASGACAGLTPAQITAKMVADARSYNTAKKNIDYGFTGDPLRPTPGRYYGYLIRAALY